MTEFWRVRGNWFALLIVTLTVVFVVPEDAWAEWTNPKANNAPKGKPQRRNAGEGVPPLPLPATPLRRSEKKREPAPPALVGNITFNRIRAKRAGLDWRTTIIDIEKWVEFTNSKLGQRYRFIGADFATFSYDPAELPIIYFTGWKPLPKFDERTIAKLRKYLLDGGTWVVHSNCGRPEFNASFRREIARIFPDRELSGIPTDHPLFSSYYDIKKMKVRKDKDPWQTVPPYLETINIGTRAAVIFSPIDLSCGWDADANPIMGGVLYDQKDALNMGANIVTYALAEYQYARFFNHQKVYHQATNATRDQLVLGQIVHNGDWDPTPHGIPNLLKKIDHSTTLNVQFKKVAVDPAKQDIFEFPVLYMTGQRKFEFSEKAQKRLKQYLANGGVLIVDAAAGSSEFDHAFRQQVAKLYPNRKLKMLDVNHAMFNFVHDVRQVKLTGHAARLLPKVKSPAVEVIEVDGTLPIIYSPISMSAGWEQLPRAYNKGYADEHALKLGVNVFMYAVSH